MESTGEVRRLDYLGKITIPIDVQRKVGISEGSPMELFLGDEGEIILKLYPSTIRLQENLENIKDLVSKMTDENSKESRFNLENKVTVNLLEIERVINSLKLENDIIKTINSRK